MQFFMHFNDELCISKTQIRSFRKNKSELLGTLIALKLGKLSEQLKLDRILIHTHLQNQKKCINLIHLSFKS